MTPRRLALAVALLSAGLLLTGVALIYPPAAFIVGGILLAGALWIDIPDATGRRRT